MKELNYYQIGNKKQKSPQNMSVEELNELHRLLTKLRNQRIDEMTEEEGTGVFYDLEQDELYEYDEDNLLQSIDNVLAVVEEM